MISVICVGDNTVDRYLHLGKMFPGGNAVNVAVHASRLGCRSAYLGWVGDDPHGRLIFDALLDEGVDLSHCRTVEGENAYCEITLKDGNRVFGKYSGGVCDQINLCKEDLDYLAEFDLVHTSVYSHLDPHLKTLSENARYLSYDFSQEWDHDLLKKVLPYVDIALISNPPGSVISNKELINFTHSVGTAKVLITSGEMGADFYDGTTTFHQEAAKINRLVDTLGAGDALAARFMVDYLNGRAITDALSSAAQFAAEACGNYGAFGHGAPIYHKKEDLI